MEKGKIKVWFPAVRAGSGTDVFTARLAKALEQRGMIAEITWLSLRHEMLPWFLNHLPPPADTDIIFANSWNGFAFKRTDIPLVVTLHHSAFDHTVDVYQSLAQRLYHHILIKPCEMRSFRVADKVTAVSRYAAKSLQQHASGIGHIEVIHNWIDVERFKPAISSQQHDGKPFRLLFVGKLSRLKGADLLAPIMQQLGFSYELRIAGKIKSDQRKNFPKNIKLLGYLNECDLIHAYQACDALLLPSRSEGFGYTALEAMSCGKPVIASNATALPELINDGINGILCSVDDVAQFANACRHLRRDAELCRKMGESARQRAIDQFSSAIAINSYVELINQLVKSKVQ